MPEGRRATMRGNKKKDTRPELAVRRLLHAMGFRFRLHRRDLPGTPDVVFPTRRKAIQVHGCFWHQHEGCRSATLPATRQEYWLPKLARNRERDRQAEAALTALGWQVMTVWECEVTDVGRLGPRLRHFLGFPKARG
ncbi:very short patch repair endonuclease [Falsiroseomonas tokyonensis]|uniref:Very short patch repair endonuclease n=1 Tax=Falsiroseomonas tokyonensis TaxID=430521 RepID=A0ABV7C5B1_9PROT